VPTEGLLDSLLDEDDIATGEERKNLLFDSNGYPWDFFILPRVGCNRKWNKRKKQEAKDITKALRQCQALTLGVL